MNKSDEQPKKLEWLRSALDRYEGPLIRYANRITGDLDRARDVVQDTFIKLCAQDPKEVEDHLAEWLFTVCRNRALDVRRKEDRMTPLSDYQMESCHSQDPSPSKAMEQREETNRVLLLLEMLPDNQQEVIRLKFQNGLSYKEISRVTNLTVTNVGFLIHTGLKALRLKLKTRESKISAV
jgi:RNA polymerase sigma factor (sigma-70 family)